MIYYILSIICFSIIFFLYLTQTRKWTHLFFLILFFVVISGILAYSLDVKPYSRGSESAYEEIILFLCMFLGMFTNSILKRIKGNKLNFKAVNFLKPLFIAPIIFFAVWGAAEKMMDLNFITCCFAYTNGYFWETILKKISEQVTKD